jgi:hypothetical protein
VQLLGGALVLGAVLVMQWPARRGTALGRTGQVAPAPH